jgi:hypothetical protein
MSVIDACPASLACALTGPLVVFRATYRQGQLSNSRRERPAQISKSPNNHAVTGLKTGRVLKVDLSIYGKAKVLRFVNYARGLTMKQAVRRPFGICTTPAQ